ncbi:hypothetical protein ROLI_012630 [Roseobacter fucihabitans]|uniref:ABM domain-containing protein n=1 Tax=Roseobacter fucihabitans TaxID=1537242 RepID=A0ABZ2BQC1_9RHOB|nr:hypothetical protein [Roseobacter litoralis]MBC6964209.1 hypothetical protein [Roseobacter litoralis]
MRILPLFTTLIAFAATDTPRGDPAPGPIAEIVSYRLKPGISIEAAVLAAQGTEAFLRETGAVISRTLSRDDNGVWTDFILWTSLQAAKETEANAMQRPEFARFFAMMAETSVELRYARVMMQMD